MSPCRISLGIKVDSYWSLELRACEVRLQRWWWVSIQPEMKMQLFETWTLSFSVKASSYSCNYMILTRHCGYILKLLPLFLIILPFCSNKFFSSAMADCSFWDWFSLRGIWWKQSFAYISRPKLDRLRTDPAALLPADDNLSTPRVAWMKAGAGWQIKQTTSLLSCLIFWENK